MSLEPEVQPPYELVSSETVGHVWRLDLRRLVVQLPGGHLKELAGIVAPPAAVMVPVFDDGTTVLVRQWRPGWWGSSWEAPAGTVEDGEEPLATARRELAEEAGLKAADWRSLGTCRGTALTSVVFHLYLARGLTETATSRDELEVDLVTRRLPLAEAVEAARSGEIQHSPSIVALWRASQALATA